MNKNISKIIESLITECECDSRIESGVFDLHNTDHLVVMSEHMERIGISESEHILSKFFELQILQ